MKNGVLRFLAFSLGVMLAVETVFAAAGWSNDIPEIEAFMRQNCDLYFKTVETFGDYLLHGKEA